MDRPRFRRDLVTESLQDDGVGYVEATDPQSGSRFRFYDFELAVAESLDGRPLEDVVADVAERTGLELSPDQLASFATRLEELGFLEPAEAVAEFNEQPTRGNVEVIEEEPFEEPFIEPVTDFVAPTATVSNQGIPLDLRGIMEPELPMDAPTETSIPAVITVEAEAEPEPPPRERPPMPPPIPHVEHHGPLAPPTDDLIPMDDEAVLEPSRAAPLPPAPTPDVDETDDMVPFNEPAAAAPVEPEAPLEAEAPVEPVASPPRRVSPLLFAGLGIALALGVGLVVFKLSATTQAPAISVRTLVPSVASVYRWLDVTGSIKPAGEKTLVFPASGKVAQVAAPGTAFKAGDLVAELETARKSRNELQHHRERLAYYEQMFESMRTSGNKSEARQAELKVAEKKRLVAETLAALAKVAVVAPSAGEVAEALVTIGVSVAGGAPAVRLKGAGMRAEFELPRDEAERVRRLAFCRVEIDGKPLDCTFSAEGSDATHVLVDLPASADAAPGKTARLAKARYDGVFVLPNAALIPGKAQGQEQDRRVYIVRGNQAQTQSVVVAEETPSEVIISQGLEAGTPVIIEIPPTLQPNARVQVTGN